MARAERRFETTPVHTPSTGHGSAKAAATDAASEAEDPAQPRPRQWTLDRIERIIGSIA